jgi:16S rRNA (uracil1498-N3)-methyltransferase
MARRRFLVTQVCDNRAELHGADARHLSRVLRATCGQQYEISDGARVYLAEISVVEDDRVVFRALETLDTSASALRLTLFAALIKFDRFEWLVEKATELGVVEILPVMAARSERGLAEASVKRVERWRRIARESSQQARRIAPPGIAASQPMAAALATSFDYRYLLDEEPDAAPLLTALAPADQRRPTDSVALLTGPEGGWTAAERAAAVEAGWKPVSLGPLILRAETASLAAAALLMHAWWASQLE